MIDVISGICEVLCLTLNYGYYTVTVAVDIGSLSRYYVDMCPLSRYCVDMCQLSRYCVDMCPLSRYCVDICPQSN